MTPIDDREARELLGPLAGEPGGTQWLDVDRIVREGDRRRRRRTIGTGALTAVFLTTVVAGTTAIVVNGRRADGEPAAGYASASASAPPYLPSARTGPDCTLSASPGAPGILAAVDHTGHYTLEEVGNSRTMTAVVRKDGVQVADVKIPPIDVPASIGGAYRINADGEFIATFTEDLGDRLGVLTYAYTAGTLTKLKDGDTPVVIADDGRMAGTVRSGAPAVWVRPDAPPADLKVPLGKQAQIMFSDQDGTLVGYAGTEGAQFANLWLPDGSSRAIPVPKGHGQPSVSGIANGWVVGYDSLNSFRYRIATKKYEVLPAQILHTQGVAANGAVVGDGTDGNLYVLSGGVARKLPQRPGMQHYTVLGISDDGRTVTADEYYPSPAGPSGREPGRAVTWTCG